MSLGNFGGGDGSAKSPFLIEDAWDLNAMRKYLSSHFILMNDINMNTNPFNEHEGWEPINDFVGVLDGNRHTIYNLYINRPSENYIGLFGHTEQPREAATFRVCDLGLENINIIGNEYIGGIIGSYGSMGGSNYPNFNNMFTRIQVTGRIKGKRYMGGIAGLFDDRYRSRIYGWTAEQVVVNQCVVCCEITPTDVYYKENSGVIGIMYMGSSSLIKKHTLSYCYSGNNTAINTVTRIWDESDFEHREYFSQNDLTCYADISINPNSSPGTQGLTTEQLKYGNGNILEEMRNLQADGHNVFRFNRGAYPQLSFVGQSYYLVRTSDNNYLTFDYDKNTWTKCFDRQPTMLQAVAVGMHDINTIPIEQWKLLKKKGNIELVNYRPQLNSVNTIETQRMMTKVVDASKKNPVLKTTISFDSEYDDIINIAPIL